jgi:thiamine-phosphate pyrophosphorylase
MALLPRLYAILDAACFSDEKALFVAAEGLAAAGCNLIQYRNKSGNARVMLAQARELMLRLASTGGQSPHPIGAQYAPIRVGHSRTIRLIMNDRADLCLAAGFDGIHVGQDDLLPESVRKIIAPAGDHPGRRGCRRSRSNLGRLFGHRSGFRHIQ